MNPSKDWRLFEVGYGEPTQYIEGHIPGAGYLDTNMLEKEPLWNKVPDNELERILIAIGLKA